MQTRAVTRSALPRSPHASLREDIRATQRGRLLAGMADAVAERGYPATTVADVIARAGVSRKAFYEHFSDKQNCFLAVCDTGVEVLAGEIAASMQAARGWRARLDALLDTYLAVLADEPAFARAYLVELWAAGPAGLERQAATIERFHAVLRALHAEALAEDAAVAPASDALIACVAGGINRLATRHVLAGRAAQLPELAEELRMFVLSVFSGPRPVAPR